MGSFGHTQLYSNGILFEWSFLWEGFGQTQLYSNGIQY